MINSASLHSLLVQPPRASQWKIITPSVSFDAIMQYYAAPSRSFRLRCHICTKIWRYKWLLRPISDTAGPDRIVPTLLVFGAFPRMSEFDAPSPTVSQRSAVLAKATVEICKLQSTRQMNEALYQRNGPAPVIQDLPLNTQVLVYREKGR